MKLVSSQPLPSNLHMQSWQVSTTPGECFCRTSFRAGSLRYSDRSSIQVSTLPSRTMNGHIPAATPESNLFTPTGKASAHPNGVTSTIDTPTRPMTIRSVSVAAALSSLLSDPASSPTSAADSPNEKPQWSSAIGGASLGKSGRVIERLMSENDRLRREIKLETSRREEMQKREEMSRPLIDSLRVERENLIQMQSVDAGFLVRRDRKIAEFKAELETERERRMRAEEAAAELLRERDDAVRASARDVGEARDKEKHAVAHAEILEASHAQLRAEYKRRTEKITKALEETKMRRDEESGKVGRLDVVVEQLRQQMERQERINREMRERFEAYKNEIDSQVEAKVQGMAEKEEHDRVLREEMQKVVGEMRWVVRLKKAVEGIDVG